MSELRSRLNSVQKRTKAKESGNKVHKIPFLQNMMHLKEWQDKSVTKYEEKLSLLSCK